MIFEGSLCQAASEGSRGRLPHPGVKKRLSKLIKTLKAIDTLDEIRHIKKIEGYDCYYRLRIGDYRLGLKIAEDTIELIRFLHRRDIYRRFP